MEKQTVKNGRNLHGGFLFIALAFVFLVAGCRQPMATTVMEWRVRHMVVPSGPAPQIHYLVQLPKGYEDDTNRLWPLVFYLHGIDESGNDPATLMRFGPPHLMAEGQNLPCIVVSPQIPAGYFAIRESNALLDILDEVTSRYRVDKHRVHATGNSIGAYGVILLVARVPERFASLVPICGGVDYLDSLRLYKVPIWAFHGAKDPIIPVEESKRLVDLVNRGGGKARLTIYPDLGHNCWDRAYQDPELWAWMLAQRK